MTRLCTNRNFRTTKLNRKVRRTLGVTAKPIVIRGINPENMDEDRVNGHEFSVNCTKINELDYTDKNIKTYETAKGIIFNYVWEKAANQYFAPQAYINILEKR